VETGTRVYRRVETRSDRRVGAIFSRNLLRIFLLFLASDQSMATPAINCQRFEDAVITIASDVVDLTAPDDLFLDARFTAIYEAPAEHTDCAERLVDAPGLSSTARAVVGLAMQRVGLDDYLRIAEKALRGQAAGVISISALEMILIPPVTWGDALLLHFQDPRVSALLEQLLRIDGIEPELARYVSEEVLTGRAAARRRLQR